MNTDGEWNDARQAQFAETHLELAGRPRRTRAHATAPMAAARAAFTTYIPACFGAQVLRLVAVATGEWRRRTTGTGDGTSSTV